ncbi:hypothetical protein PanWU01x14_351600, partial [Parasponia andersonii]
LLACVEQGGKCIKFISSFYLLTFFLTFLIFFEETESYRRIFSVHQTLCDDDAECMVICKERDQQTIKAVCLPKPGIMDKHNFYCYLPLNYHKCLDIYILCPIMQYLMLLFKKRKRN